MDLPVSAMHIVCTTESNNFIMQNELSQEVIDSDSAIKCNYSVKGTFQRYRGHSRAEPSPQFMAPSVAANSTAGIVRRGLRNSMEPFKSVI